jgi:hypothetical protein
MNLPLYRCTPARWNCNTISEPLQKKHLQRMAGGGRKRDLNCIDVMNGVITANICIRNISVNG